MPIAYRRAQRYGGYDMNHALDLSLYYITAPAPAEKTLAIALAAARGGATVVQLRNKVLGDTDFVSLGRQLKQALDPLGVPLIVNDRIDLIAAIGAAGGHIGQGDIPLEIARDILGPDAILGLSTSNSAQVKSIDWQFVDYIGAGPFRATKSKSDHAVPIGAIGLGNICTCSNVPVVAIGGIVEADVPTLRAAGASGMAVISAIADNPDPKTAASALAKAWRA